MMEKSKIKKQITQNKVIPRFQRIPTKIFFIIIILFAFFIYSQSTSFDFIYNWDDNVNVTENNYIKDFTWTGIKTLFSPETKIEEPRLTLFSYAIIHHFWGLKPYPYHVFNILLYLLTIFLVFTFIRILIGNNNIALITCGLFALHPMHVESVAWITGLKDLQYSIFFLISLIFYIQYIKKNLNLLFLIIAFIAGYLSLLSKIQAVTLPVILFSLDYFFSRKANARMFFEKIFLALILLNLLSFKVAIILLFLQLFLIYNDKIFKLKNQKKFKLTVVVLLLLLGFSQIYFYSKFISLIFLIFTCWAFIENYYSNDKKSIHFLGNVLFKYKKTIILSFIGLLSLGFILFMYFNLQLWNTQTSRDFSFIDRIFMAGYSLTFYIEKCFLPVNLSSFYTYPEKINGFLPGLYYIFSGLSLMFITTFFILLYKIKNYKKELVFGILFFAVNIFLFLHLIPIQGRVITADRYAFMAYIGLFFLIGFYTEKWIEKKPNYTIIIFLFFTAILYSLGVLSNNRIKVWKNELVLFNDLIEKHPQSAMFYTNRGTILFKNNQIGEALSDYEKAIQIDPKFSLSYYNRALIYVNQQKFSLAIADCNLAIKYGSAGFESYYLRGYSKNQIEDFKGAIYDLDSATKLNPKSHLAYFNKALAKKNNGDFTGAITDYSTAINLAPSFAEAYNNRGIVKYLQKEFSSSIEDYNRAIKYNSNNKNAYFNKGLSELELKMKEKACGNFQIAKRLGHSNAEKYLIQNCK